MKGRHPLIVGIGKGRRSTLSCTPEAAVGGILVQEGLAAQGLLEGEMLELGPEPPLEESQGHSVGGGYTALEMAAKTTEKGV